MPLRLISRVRRALSKKSQPEGNSERNQPYKKPASRQLSLEQAKLKIIGHAVVGNQGAKELMELLYQKPPAPAKSNETKKSA